jgi:hypothetical protein
LKKIEDVQSMCSKRKADLQTQARAQPVHHPAQPDLVTSSSRGQTTVPEYDLRKKGGHRDRHRKESKDTTKKGAPAVPSVEKSARVNYAFLCEIENF